MKRYAMLGTAGFIGEKHLKAIKETGGELVCFHDPSDSVGIIDSYFPEADYFSVFERFDRAIDLHQHSLKPIDYLVICSPNYMHDSHIRYGLRAGLDVICEKPLVLNPHNLEGLEVLESQTGHRINNILQMRLHPEVIKLKQTMANVKTKYDVSLEYYTARGSWYAFSWKGDKAKSGGIATNIGIHLVDMLIYIFGEPLNYEITGKSDMRITGLIEFKRATVDFVLCINPEGIPGGGRSYRKITVGGNELDISKGFTDLHTESYKKILAGEGWSVEDARPAIEFVSKIR